MTYNPDIHHRRSVRLKEYDYRSAGAYFVTICTFQRECLFGDVVDGEMRLNNFGEIVLEEWLRSEVVRNNVSLDGFVTMPNHFHSILLLNDSCRGEALPRPVVAGSIGAILGQFKSIVTKRINALRDNPGCPVWQRNYYEHVIRNEDDLANIRQYIANNPLKWDMDENNPVNAVTIP
ncbi:MAG: transposase [Pelobacteraceae bacterium]